MSKTTWIASLVIVQTVVSLLLTSIMVLTGWIVFHITAYPDPFSVFIIFLGTLVPTGFGVLIGGVLKEAEAITALGNSLSFLMMFLSGAFWPLELMPSFLQEVARYIPLRVERIAHLWLNIYGYDADGFCGVHGGCRLIIGVNNHEVAGFLEVFLA